MGRGEDAPHLIDGPLLYDSLDRENANVNPNTPVSRGSTPAIVWFVILCVFFLFAGLIAWIIADLKSIEGYSAGAQWLLWLMRSALPIGFALGIAGGVGWLIGKARKDSKLNLYQGIYYDHKMAREMFSELSDLHFQVALERAKQSKFASAHTLTYNHAPRNETTTTEVGGSVIEDSYEKDPDQTDIEALLKQRFISRSGDSLYLGPREEETT